LDDPNMRGDAASNPTEQMYFHLTTWNPYSSVQITSNFQVLIEYDVMFHEPRTPSLSLRKVEEKDKDKEVSLAVGLDEKVASCGSRRELALEDDYDACMYDLSKVTMDVVSRKERSSVGLGDLTLAQRRRINNSRAPNLEGC